MDDANIDRKRFSELLPFHINRTLKASDQEWMEAYLSSHPDAQSEFKFEQFLRDTTKRTTSSIPEDQRVAKLMNALQLARPKKTWYSRWLGIGMSNRKDSNGFRISMAAPAFAAIILLIVGQAIFIGLNSPFDSSVKENYRGMSAPCAQAQQLRITFKPDAQNAAMVLLLRSVEAVVVSGPSETGEIWLALAPSASPEKVQAVLRSSAIVEEVVLVKASAQTAKCKAP